MDGVHVVVRCQLLLLLLLGVLRDESSCQEREESRRERRKWKDERKKEWMRERKKEK